MKNKPLAQIDFSTTIVHKIGHDLGLEDFDEYFCDHLRVNLIDEVERVWVENWYLDIKL